jgi:DNA-binding response OmpR family regulator
MARLLTFEVQSAERQVRRGISMAATMKTAISPFGQPKTEPGANSIHFLDEDLALLPASGIPEEFRKLSRFLTVIVLVPKSAVHDKTTQKKPGLKKSVISLINTSDVCLPLDAAKAWLRNLNATDTFEFGGVKGCFSAMEIHRNGRPVILTCKEFKTLAYFIKNPRRVISRDELLNEVWGYENYPCTRTVDNHILRLRKKLETEPGHPKHFHTVNGSGYKFLP